ncbi:AGAP007385-PA-like protein [Anopheles sinensis]|uniref:lysozyme n=1 Tax=Anopheles sinensis TaxID=74873 RepID=A0A084WN26_ANOSI|nr:AGAP007385-PA-like protein [Anopheles sinensis]
MGVAHDRPSSRRQCVEKVSFLAFVSLMLLAQSSIVRAKVFEKCPLARTLDREQISSRSLISNWVCLIMAESGADTAKLTTLPNESKSYGIFQINSKTWCREGRKGGTCNKACEDFLTDDLADDIECAKKIYQEGGFGAWKGWVNKCKQKTLPDLSGCWK